MGAMSSDNSQADLEALAASIISPDKGHYLGPFLMAMVIDALFQGYILGQFITWLTSGRSEQLRVKVLVIFAMVVSTATSIFTWSTMMRLFVFGFGEYAPFTTYYYTGRYGLLCSLSVTAVQLFYVDRAYHMTKRNLPILIITLGILAVGLVGAMGFTAVSRFQPVFDANKITMVFLFLWPAATSIADLIITGAISYGLLKSKTGWTRTDAIIFRLVRLSAECQLPPTLLAVAFIIMHAINSRLVVSVVFLIIHPKVYLWGCLTVLNARESPLHQGPQTNTNSALQSTPYVRTSSPVSHKGVMITQETVVETSPSALASDLELAQFSPRFRSDKPHSSPNSAPAHAPQQAQQHSDAVHYTGSDCEQLRRTSSEVTATTSRSGTAGIRQPFTFYVTEPQVGRSEQGSVSSVGKSEY